MGLVTSHDCWHGAYSAFNRWRVELAQVAGLPPLELMEGFFQLDQAVTGNPFWMQLENDKRMGFNGPHMIWARLPIKWGCLKENALHELLHHSDCEGEIPWESCGQIADSLEKLIPLLPSGEAGVHIGNWRDKTAQFVAGLRKASEAKENVNFH
jgi:hypothetical protein